MRNSEAIRDAAKAFAAAGNRETKETRAAKEGMVEVYRREKSIPAEDVVDAEMPLADRIAEAEGAERFHWLHFLIADAGDPEGAAEMLEPAGAGQLVAALDLLPENDREAAFRAVFRSWFRLGGAGAFTRLDDFARLERAMEALAPRPALSAAARAEAAAAATASPGARAAAARVLGALPARPEEEAALLVPLWKERLKAGIGMKDENRYDAVSVGSDYIVNRAAEAPAWQRPYVVRALEELLAETSGPDRLDVEGALASLKAGSWKKSYER